MTLSRLHDDVGHHDDPHRAPQLRDGLDFILVDALGDEELGSDIDQRQTTDQFEIRQQHELPDDAGENQAQQHRDAGADHQAPEALALRQIPARHRNDDGVVARQQDIDENDLQHRGPERRASQIVDACVEHVAPQRRMQILQD